MKCISTRHAISLACAALFISACGGGGGSSSGPSSSASSSPSSTAANSSSTTSGTVTGFGSIIVDGTRIDDHTVAAVVENDDDTETHTELKLGQHVEVRHDGNMVATAVHVRDEVEGTVTAVDTVGGTLSVLGQTVVINTDAAKGPITVFEAPYAQLGDIQVNDFIEVHGLIKADISGNTFIQATRIEKKTAQAISRVEGLVSALSTSASTFQIGGLVISYDSSTRISPNGAKLANGEEVRVSVQTGTTPAKATVIKIRNRKNEGHGNKSEIGGAVSHIDVGAKTFVIADVTVDASSATFSQPGKSFLDLSDNTYVAVHGAFNDAGVFTASRIVIRGIPDGDNPEVELHGTILNFTSNADFTVRDVHVDASGATVDSASCQGTTLANGMQVEIKGDLTATGKVTATSVKCESDDDAEIIGRVGAASSVDAAAKTFNLAASSGTVSVHWSDATVFVNVDVSSLDGKTVEVEGTLSGNVIEATKIKLED